MRVCGEKTTEAQVGNSLLLAAGKNITCLSFNIFKFNAFFKQLFVTVLF